ncbi:hypothetical protein B0H14DRAFT_2649381 [Mycena olivaceomarginata]|nr:hypothetical protein B0H14DRAFT_2649381 [Mycena olivaceomarginata]
MSSEARTVSIAGAQSPQRAMSQRQNYPIFAVEAAYRRAVIAHCAGLRVELVRLVTIEVPATQYVVRVWYTRHSRVELSHAKDPENHSYLDNLAGAQFSAADAQSSAVGERIAHSTKFIAILVEKAVEPLAPIRQARFKVGDGMSAAAKKGPRGP